MDVCGRCVTDAQRTRGTVIAVVWMYRFSPGPTASTFSWLPPAGEQGGQSHIASSLEVLRLAGLFMVLAKRQTWALCVG